jgi:hypothetical protein
MCLRPTHYTIKRGGDGLKSWIVEYSLDGRNWTEVDRKSDSTDFKRNQKIGSFQFPKEFDCSFIRLTQTGKNHSNNDLLELCAFEIFGTLLE